MKAWITSLGFAITVFAWNAIAIPVVTSTTDLAWAVREIGGSHVEVSPLLRGKENPHFVDAVPEFIRLTADAAMVAIIGLDLEVGWMPKVLSRSMNAGVQPGGRGHCDVGKTIEVLEKPVGGVDRSMGDVHPSGNPHFWLSPVHFIQAGKPLHRTLTELDPAHAAHFDNGLKQFTEKLQAIHKRNEAKIKGHFKNGQPPKIMEYHREFSYFFNAYGLRSHGSIEEKPGVTPSAGRLAEVAVSAKAAGVQLALASTTAPKKTLERFTELSGIPVVQLPMSLVPNGEWKEYGEHHDHVVESIVRELKKTEGPKAGAR